MDDVGINIIVIITHIIIISAAVLVVYMFFNLHIDEKKKKRLFRIYILLFVITILLFIAIITHLLKDRPTMAIYIRPINCSGFIAVTPNKPVLPYSP
jgi:Na+/proline symporter